MSDVSPLEVRRTVVLTVLTVFAGAVDAVSFLTMGKVFCALATGNVLFLAFALAGAGDVPVARPAAAIGAFLAGAGLGAVLLRWFAARGWRWFAVGLVAEGVLLVGAGAVALVRHGTGDAGSGVDADLVVVAGVALAMGLRASTVLRVHVPGMPTLLSQTAFAQLLNALSERPRVVWRGMPARERMARVRWTATVVGIFAGGVLGTLLLVPLGTGWALVGIGAGVLVLAGVGRAALR